MSAAAPINEYDHREQLARIDRAIAETHKLQIESDKLAAEQRKLTEEALKLRRDRFFVPFTLLAALGGLGGLVTLVQWLGRFGGH